MKNPYKVYKMKVEDHIFWVAESSCLKGCVGQGDTIEEAVSTLEENEEVWLETAEECGIDIPDIPIETDNDYSGKFTVRVSPYVHKMASIYAQKQRISLNQYVNDAIVAQNAVFETISHIQPVVRESIDEIRDAISYRRPTFSEGTTVLSASGGDITITTIDYLSKSNSETQTRAAKSLS